MPQTKEEKEAREKLISDTQARLDAVSDDPAVKDDSTPEKKPAEETTQSVSEEKPAEETKVESTPASEEKPAEEDKPELLAAYKRAALHQGMTEEDIEDFFTTDPEKANKVFASLLKTTNELSNKFAELGRANQKTVDKAAEVKPVVEEVKGIDLTALRETYKDDPLFGIVETLASQVTELRKKPASQPASEGTGDTNAELIAANKTVQGFFGDLKPYEDFYGPDTENWDDLTITQYQHRNDVLVLSDQIAAGALQQGLNMSMDKALDLAHLSISQPFIDKAIRGELKAKTVARNGNIVVKPSGSAKTVVGDVKEGTVVTRTAGRLHKVFG